MEDKIYFLILLMLAFVGIWYGMANVLGGSFVSSGSAYPESGLFASAFAAVETDFASNSGEFLISFDGFKNIHPVILDDSKPVKIFDFDYVAKENLVFASTDSGLYLSRDKGLTWNLFNSSNNEINKSSIIFKIIPFSSNGEDYLISVFSGGRGYVYRTYDYFFNLEKMISFDGEAVYDMHLSGSSIYLAVSNGQIIRFNLGTKESTVVNAFSSPVVKIYKVNGNFYLLLKSGLVLKNSALEDKFEKINLPDQGFLFGSSKVKSIDFDSAGNIYLLNTQGAYISYDGGKKFNLIKTAPLQSKEIDAFAQNGGIIYLISDSRMFTSYNQTQTWKITDLYNQFTINSIDFFGPISILSI